MKDLVLLVADKNMEGSLKGILARPAALGLREISFDLYIHPEKDPGCLRRCHTFLQAFSHQYRYALVLLDHEGCGREETDRLELETELEARLAETGWERRAAAVVIAPELEIWVWSDSPHVDRILGWKAEGPLRDWMVERGYLTPGQVKPGRPKDAVEEILRTVRLPRSSSLYNQLARTVSLEKCVDPAFAKLRRCLSGWFPAAPRRD
jgi:hypothetical protein